MTGSTTAGYGTEQHEVDAAVLAVLADLLGATADLTDPIVRYHELTRAQRLWEAVGPRVLTALVAERGAALRATGMTQVDLTDPTGLGTRQRVSQIMQAAGRRDPIAVRLVSAEQ